MAIDAKHPFYTWFSPDWQMLRDVYRGERIVKDAGTVYLPATAGMILDGMLHGQLGYARYQAYKQRAVFYEYLSEGVEMLIGLLHQKSATIELPADMEPLRNRATPSGESLDMLLRRINEQQLIVGRCGLLADLPSEPSTDPSVLPHIALYQAESIINWDDNLSDRTSDKLTLVILEEKHNQRDESFEWKDVTKYRILSLDGNKYRQGLYDEKVEYDINGMTTPLLRGRDFDSIPFVFVNSKDIVPEPDRPPLLGLANMSLSIYRSDADYRQSLHMQGQDTLVIIGTVRNPDASVGDSDAIRTGAGARIDVDIGGDAKYIGVSPNGIPEQRFALDNDKKLASNKAGQLVNTSVGQRESGDALRTRLAAQTATLNSIALASAAGLEVILKAIARWKGSDESKIKVQPSLEFTDFNLEGDEFLKFMTARQMGLPLSKESLHAMLRERGHTKMEFEAEMDTIEKEDAANPPLLPAPSVGGAAGQPGGSGAAAGRQAGQRAASGRPPAVR